MLNKKNAIPCEIIKQTLLEFEEIKLLQEKSIELSNIPIPITKDFFHLHFYNLFAVNNSYESIQFDDFCKKIFIFYDALQNNTFTEYRKRPNLFDDDHNNGIIDLLKTKELLQIELSRYEVHNKMTLTIFSKLKKNTKATKLSAMARIELLNRIGFNELEFVKKLDSKQLKSLLTTVLNYAERDISGYVNGLTSTSKESKFFITDVHKEDVDKYLKDLL
ncbi:hypothetical protein [Soonwooa sp.]|uniref:hypothetical protein n=1 Tax=Soonwooa sp. TaxID=1938592 RepID=UPI0035B352E2